MTRSPLIEALVLFFLLGIFALPLAHLTTEKGVAATSLIIGNSFELEENNSADPIGVLIKLKGSTLLERVLIQYEGKTILELDSIDSTEVEAEINLYGLELENFFTAEIVFKELGEEQAVRLEFWPDALSEKTVTFWGKGEVFHEFSFHWPELHIDTAVNP